MAAALSVVVLHDRGDPSAAWLQHGLAARGVPVLGVTGDDLVGAPRFGHGVGGGPPRLRVRLRDGRGFTHRSVAAVVNRLTHLPPPGEGRTSDADRQYAHDELTAIALSWLSALATTVPFVGRPSASWLGGEWRTPAEWAILAHSAGLSAAPVDLPSGPGGQDGAPGALSRALVVADLVWFSGPPPDSSARDALRAGLVRLARLADRETLGVLLDAGGRVVGVDPLPDLRPSGAAGVARLAELLGRGGGAA